MPDAERSETDPEHELVGMNGSEKTHFNKRAARYAQVSGAVMRIGAAHVKNVVGRTRNKPPDITSTDHEAGRHSNASKQDPLAGILRQALGGLKGPLMKVAQILSALPDAIPRDIAAELAHLQADAPPMGAAFVDRRLRGELGRDWRTRFAAFDMTAASAASLGQVHRARAHDGTSLACKLQYPDMPSVVDADLQQLKLIFKIFETFDGGSIALRDVWTEIAARLHEELDYRREAQNIALYRFMTRDLDGVHIPDVYPDLSTERLLTMTWCEGSKLLDSLKTRTQGDRNTLALTMFRLWYTPFYRYGVLHGDPHPGNYTARADNSINLLDFGCIRIFPPRLVEGVVMLWHALRTQDDDRAAEAYRIWGFSPITKELIETLNLWARFVYAPLLDDRVQTLDETNSGLEGRAVAGRVHDALKKLGTGVRVPREFVFIDRATLGLGGLFLRLGAQLNWHTLFCEVTEGFDVQEVAKNQQKALEITGLTSSVEGT